MPSLMKATCWRTWTLSATTTSWLLTLVHRHSVKRLFFVILLCRFTSRHVLTLVLSVGRASLATDRNSVTEQPLRADVSAQLHYAFYVLQLHYTAVQNVFYGEFVYLVALLALDRWKLCHLMLNHTQKLHTFILKLQTCPLAFYVLNCDLLNRC